MGTNKPEKEQKKFQSGNNTQAGIVIIIIGIIILLNKLPLTAGLFPFWFFSWPMLLIGIGLFTGVRSGFKGPAWVILSLLGLYFLLQYNHFISVNLKPYLFPLGVIIAGIAMVLSRKNNSSCQKKQQTPFQAGNTISDTSSDNDDNMFTTNSGSSSEDLINANALFGSIERSIFSKDFKQGNVSGVFAGVQLNFVQADIKDSAVLEVTVVFGGLELIVPSNWIVKNEIPAVFGGVEDKRRFAPNNDSPHEKVLILKGTVIFGGIEIKSF